MRIQRKRVLLENSGGPVGLLGPNQSVKCETSDSLLLLIDTSTATQTISLSIAPNSQAFASLLRTKSFSPASYCSSFSRSPCLQSILKLLHPFSQPVSLSSLLFKRFPHLLLQLRHEIPGPLWANVDALGQYGTQVRRKT